MKRRGRSVPESERASPNLAAEVSQTAGTVTFAIRGISSHRALDGLFAASPAYATFRRGWLSVRIVSEMEPAPELVLFMERLYRSLTARDFETLSDATSRHPGTSLIDSAPDEWWTGTMTSWP